MSTSCPLCVYMVSIDKTYEDKNMKNDYQIDRKGASRLLKVSIRTVDRYIKQKKLSTRIVDGRVWLSRSEVTRSKYKTVSTPIVDNVDMSTPEMSIDNQVDNTVDTVNIVSTSKTQRNGISIYKTLLVDTQNEVRENQRRLEMANYRIGQLESQISSSIPLLDFNKEKEEKRLVIKQISTELKKERLGKLLLLLGLLTVLALQPLWLLMLK